MAGTRWDPFTALARLDRELDSSFDELVRRAWGSGPRQTAGFVPAVEMRVQGSDVLITLELPGVDVDRDVTIEASDGRLAISGERRFEQAEGDGKDKPGVLVRELRYGSFRREFALPEHVGPDDVEAFYDRGLLHVAVRGVMKPAAQPRRIQVRSAGAGTHAVQASQGPAEVEA